MTRPVGSHLLRVQDLVKDYPGTGRRRPTVQAVAGVSFDVQRAEAVSLVGESGCGKSTTARCVVRLLAPTSGSITFDGTEIARMSAAELRALRPRFQMVFQDPQASLNPHHKVRDIIGEPLVVRGDDRGSVADRVAGLASNVHLRSEELDRYPHQLSGGQRQRVGIARALALEPDLLVLDEPVSALDVSVQAQVVRLLRELRERMGLAYLLIAHDLAVVRHLSDRVVVMYLGVVVESGRRLDVYQRALHPYTQALLSAAPVADPDIERSRRRIILTGDVPSPLQPPTGCRFRTRCWKATTVCADESPRLVDAGDGHLVACHHPEELDVLRHSPRPDLRAH